MPYSPTQLRNIGGASGYQQLTLPTCTHNTASRYLTAYTSHRHTQQCIPPILRGKHTIVYSPTGTGKTLAYLLPMLQQARKRPAATYQCVLVVPSRELGNQVRDDVMVVVNINVCYVCECKYFSPSTFFGRVLCFCMCVCVYAADIDWRVGGLTCETKL